MQVQDFARAYRAKSDEELIQLAIAQDELTSEAQLALQSELFQRKINTTEESEAPQHDEGRHNARHAIVKEGEWPGVGVFVGEVVRTYHDHFWLFFKITAPAVVISTIAIVAGRNEVSEIYGTILRGSPLTPYSAAELLKYRIELFEVYSITFAEFLISWMAFSFSYGAICIAVEEAGAGFVPSAWRSFSNLRERLGPILRTCLLLFFLVLVAFGTSTLLLERAIWASHRWQMRSSAHVVTAASYAVTGLLLLVISRFALALPAVILDDYGVGKAMFRSDRLTQGKWLTLASLLAKSLVGGYVAGMFPFWLVSFVHINSPLPSLLPWGLTLASVACVTVAEPPMFIGFALLYLKMSDQVPMSNRALTGQPT